MGKVENSLASSLANCVKKGSVHNWAFSHRICSAVAL
jgi:hypothetical protein